MNLGRTAKLSTKKERITIDRTTESVEVDLDFTQLYSCFFYLSIGIKSGSSFQILFYLLRHMDKDNQVVINKKLVEQFFELTRQLGKKPISEQAFYTSLKQLLEAGVMKKLCKGTYFMNPYAMWKDDGVKRKEYIKTDAGIGQSFSINPIDMLLKDPECEYKLEVMQDDTVELEE